MNIRPATDDQGRRLDGPTIEQWLEHGYDEDKYPPEGWAPVMSPAYEAYLEQLTAPE